MYTTGKLTDLGWRPRDTVLAGVHAIHDKLASAAYIVDRILEDLDAACGLDNDVESMRVLCPDLGKLRAGVFAREGDVVIAGTKGLG